MPNNKAVWIFFYWKINAGFEKDVFKAICDYFNVKKEPIVTFAMYNTFIDLYQRCISLDGSCQDTQHSFFDGI